MSARRDIRRYALAGVAAVLFGAWVLFRFPPESYGFYPTCPFHELTGLLCPGCGGTRAIAALLRGHWIEALHWNALVVLMLPFLLGYGLAGWRRTVCQDVPVWPRVDHRGIAALLAGAGAFTIARNLL